MTDDILNTLDSNFAKTIKTLLQELRSEGYTIKPTQGLRTLEQQAKLWRRGRSTAIIKQRIDFLKENNCEFLANILEKAGPQKETKIATNAIPGLSWHNWGLACDFLFFDKNNKIIHNGDAPEYKILAEKAENLELTSSLSFKSIREAGHIQAHPFEVLSRQTLQYVNNHFKNLAANEIRHTAQTHC